MCIKRKCSGPTSVTLDIAYSLHGRSGHRKASRLISSSVEQVFETNKRKVSRGRNIGGISHIERLLSQFVGKVSSLGKYDPGNAAKVRETYRIETC